VEIGLNLPVVNPATTPTVLRMLAQRAEELGFAELYLGEHVVLFDDPADDYPGSDDGQAFFASQANLPDPLQTLTWLAALTDRIRLATGVALIPQRNPVYTAKHVATLDFLSGGRFDFTIGIGWNRDEFAACNVEWADRAERCREYVEVMKRLWCDPVSQFSGRFYELPACRSHPKPVQQPHPPLWFGGVSDAALARTADLGTGWYVFDLTPEELARGRQRLGELLEQRGRRPGEVTIAHGVWNRLPVSVELVEEYRRAGCDQFVVSLVGPTLADMTDQLEWFARELVGRFGDGLDDRS
jgi:probable F420-dependent oxidoreductase